MNASTDVQELWAQRTAEELSDGSWVFGVSILEGDCSIVEMPCPDEKSALALLEAIEKYALNVID